ncbi:MAG TPA: DUF4124 domain-containing protein [Cellvibrio sp.]|nr:DUF4124 domain-containing protein [Cellvibrio sp.]
MFRLLFKSVVVLVLVFAIGNYLIYLKTGQLPLHDMRERMGGDWLVDLRELVSNKLSPDQLAADAKGVMKSVSDQVIEPDTPVPTKVYKWTDANGQVHFGDKPVTSDAEQIEVDTRNAISAPEQSADRVTSPTPTTKTVSESALDKARAAAEAMKQRAQQQEQVQ